MYNNPGPTGSTALTRPPAPVSALGWGRPGNLADGREQPEGSPRAGGRAVCLPGLASPGVTGFGLVVAG